jgi:hypothetical protein
VSADLAHKKRIQAGLSLAGAGLGLAALGTKGGAVATRQTLKRVPEVARRLKLTPKVAEKADKASLGLVTTASGLGGASGIHFAALQREEAKKEDRVAKNAFGVVHKGDVWWGRDGIGYPGVPDPDNPGQVKRDQSLARESDGVQGLHRRQFIKREKEAPNRGGMGDPAVPQRRLRLVPPPKTLPPRKPDGFNPESRRQTRMKAEEAGLGGAAAVTAGSTGTKVYRTALASRAVKDSSKRTMRLARKRDANALAAWTHNAAKPQDKKMAAHHAKKALGYAKAAQRSEGKTLAYRALRRQHGRGSVAAAATTGALVAGAAGVHHMRQHQGKKYTDWWDD